MFTLLPWIHQNHLNSLLNANIHRAINIIIAGVQINDIYFNNISLTRERRFQFRIMLKLIKLLEYRQNISYWKIYSNIFFLHPSCNLTISTNETKFQNIIILFCIVKSLGWENLCSYWSPLCLLMLITSLLCKLLLPFIMVKYGWHVLWFMVSCGVMVFPKHG